MGVTSKFSEQVNGAVKAELARRDVTGVELTAPLSLNRNSVYARLRGEMPWNTDELAKVAAFLGIPLATLFASATVDSVAAEAVAS